MSQHPLSQPVDEDSHGIVTIDSAHRMVHRGRMFIVSYKNPDNSTIADNATLRLLIITGARPIHVIVSATSSGEGEIEIYEGTTSSNNGTVLGVVSMNREANLFIPTAAAYHSNSLTNAGLLLYNALIPGGASTNPTGARVGTVARENTEWIFKPNTVYMIRVTNRSGVAGYLSSSVQFYEEEE